MTSKKYIPALYLILWIYNWPTLLLRGTEFSLSKKLKQNWKIVVRKNTFVEIEKQKKFQKLVCVSPSAFCRPKKPGGGGGGWMWVVSIGKTLVFGRVRGRAQMGYVCVVVYVTGVSVWLIYSTQKKSNQQDSAFNTGDTSTMWSL